MKPTLLILAAGMGSRYGSLKQLDGVGPAGETIIDYSVYDAIRAGFGKVVFVIRESFAEEFRNQITAKFSDRIEVVFVFQEVNTPIDGVTELPNREKPWGTAHAMLVAKDVIHEPFAVINADDYYGVSSFRKMAAFLQNQVTPDNYSMVGFQLSKTISENGSVSRGVCAMDDQNTLITITERTKIERIDGTICYFEDGQRVPLTDDTLVSMNFWGFHHNIFEVTNKLFIDFVKDHFDQPRAEFFIPLVVNKMIEDQTAKITVLDSDEKWYGVTYKEDKESVQQAMMGLTESGLYSNPLWQPIGALG
ncbi:MAG: sugar phosphate nucleotidyltransferase [Bacteroidota bacterium]